MQVTICSPPTHTHTATMVPQLLLGFLCHLSFLQVTSCLTGSRPGNGCLGRHLAHSWLLISLVIDSFPMTALAFLLLLKGPPHRWLWEPQVSGMKTQALTPEVHRGKMKSSSPLNPLLLAGGIWRIGYSKLFGRIKTKPLPLDGDQPSAVTLGSGLSHRRHIQKKGARPDALE